MSKRTLIAMLIAFVVAGFSALYENEGRVITPISAKEAVAESIDKLTEQKRVVSYLQQHRRLPDYYITKKQAREQGWNSRNGDLCSVLPGKAIGGDYFSNRERQLPIANKRVWHEADINYQCGHRGSERLLYSSDGLIFATDDHYKNFVRVE